MAVFTVITAAQVDAKSPVSDDWTDLLRTNLDYLKDVLTNGATASQTIVTNKVDIRNTGALAFNNDGQMQQDGDAQFDGSVNIDGTLTVGSFQRSDDLLFLSGF